MDKHYRFSNKKEIKNIKIGLALLFAIQILFILINDKTVFFYLFCSIAGFTVLVVFRRYFKRAKESFEEIIIMEGACKFYFFQKTKNPISFNTSEMEIIIFQERIHFNQKRDKKFIGTAYKNAIEEADKWDELLLSIGNISK